MVFLAFTANAQLSFTFVPSNSMPDLGETITVDVVVNGFTDIASYQYSINWNETNLDYQGVSNFGLPGLTSGGNFGQTQINQGILTTSWWDPDGGTQSLTDGSVLFTITFDVVASGATSTEIQFSENPLFFEIIADQGGLTDITGSTTFNNTTIDVAGGNVGGGPTCDFSGFGLTVTSDSAATGNNVCLDVAACNFDQIVSMQYTMQFDPTTLQFNNVENFNLQNLEAGAFGTTNAGNGFITLSWFDSLGSGVTVPDETVLYSICFTAIGAGGEVDTVMINDALAPIEVTDANSGGGNIGLESVDGEVRITGNSGSAVTILASQAQGGMGDTVTIDISVRNFDSIASLQGSMLWDPAIVSFFDVESSGNLPGSPNFNTSSTLTDAGKLTFSWEDPDAQGASVNDDVIIFSIRYIVIGEAGDESVVDFTSDPTPIEVSQAINGQLELVPLAKIPGLVNVTGDGLLELTINQISGCTGDTVCIPITTLNYNGVVSMLFDMRWDSMDLRFVRTQDFSISGLDANDFNLLNAGEIRHSWFELNLEPQTLANGDTLVSLCFEILAGDGEVVPVFFDQTSIIEITDGNNAIPNMVNDGGITVDCSMGAPMEVSDTLITNVSCNGATDGAIDITISNSVGTVTYNWSNSETSQDLNNLPAGDYTVTITDDNTTLIETYTVTEPDVLTVAMSSMDATTNGGSDGEATATPSGGTSPYNYSWSPGGGTTQTITNLSAGTYMVTVTDAEGCTVTDQVDVNEPNAISTTIVGTNVSCNGANDGEVTVTPTGGDEPYSYNWSPNVGSGATITNLSGGTYSVTITDNTGVTATSSVTINEPAPLTVDVTDDNVTCNGANDGTATATPGGGNGSYTYEWSPGGGTTQTITDLAAGQYTVTVTDVQGCTETGTTFVSEPDPLTVSGDVTHESGVGAENGEITVTPSGGTAGYTYQWSPNVGNGATVTSLAPGDYTVTVTDANSCTVVETFTVNEFDAPVITVENVTNVLCNGEATGAIDISVAGGVTPYTYNWSPDGETSQDISGKVAGNYTVTVTDDIGTTAVETITISEATAISIVIDGQNNILCNGEATGSINISVSGGNAPYSYDWGAGGTNEDPSNLPAGTYTVTVTDNNSCTAVGTTVTITQPDALDVAIVSSTNINCNGDATGAIDINVTGGTTPYDYDWGISTLEDLTGLTAGTYTVTVTDENGCTIVGPTVTLSEPPAITASSSSTSVSCNGEADGTITLNVSGGVPGYNYNWSPSLPNQPNHNNVPAGTYNVTITDVAGCTIVEGPIAVTQPAALSISNTVTNASASNDDGAIDLTVNGGTPNYTYNWSNGATSQDLSGLASGCYAVTVTDANACEVRDSIKVGGIIVLTADVSDVSCAGICDGEINLSVNGGIAPYTYTWAGSGVTNGVEDQTGLCAGAYSVTVADSNGSLATQNFTVGTPTALTIAGSDIQDESGDGCNGSINISITGGTLPYTYNWSNGATNEDPVDLCKGDYSVTITDANGCILTSDFTVSPPPLVVANDQMTMVSCSGGNDGQICVSVLGGCGPYTLTLNGDEQTSVSGENVCFDGLSVGNYSIVIQDSGSPQMVLVHPFTITEPSPITITVNNVIDNTDPTGTNCTGAINITVVGGTGGYDYEWSNGDTSEDISELCEDLSPYTVTITDANGCTSVSEEIEIDLGLSIEVVEVNDVSCFGDCNGSIDIQVFGGMAPYSYAWSPGGMTSQDVTGLCAGVYTVQVTDNNGLTANATITVESPASALSVEVGNTNNPTADEANGLIELDISGGWGVNPDDITWSNGMTGAIIGGLVEGFYTATVVDANGCVEVITVELEADRITLDFVFTEPSCNGDADGQIEVLISGSGSGDYSITWDHGQSGELAFELEAGTYCVTVDDNNIAGLSVNTCVDLVQPDVLAINIIGTNPTGPANGLVQAEVTGGTQPYTYLWNTDNADITPTVDGLNAGTYGLIVEDDNGCTDISTIELVPGGECLEARKVISPNNDGKNDELIIRCVEGLNNTLKIFNRWGQMVYQVNNYDNTWAGTDQDGDLLPESGYFWVLEYDDNGQQKVLKGAFTLLRGEN